MDTQGKSTRDLAIWGSAFGYFAAYAPYSAMTKAVSSGFIDGTTARLSGVAILPLSVIASMCGMVAFLVATGWWRHAVKPTRAGRLPLPTRYTFVSGLLTALIVVTTTLSYTFTGVSIVFVMLLMRGGVLAIAPVVDAVTGRRPRWFSWLALSLSLVALIVAFAEEGGYEITVLCAVDVGVYLLAYFVRLQFMSRLAKSTDGDANTRYFVEEQIVATPAVVVALALVALVVVGPAESVPVRFAAELRFGFVEIFAHPAWPHVVFIGLCSQLTGVFGGLILLDKRDNTYCVPVNRASSILAGIVASYLLLAFVDAALAPSSYELVGALLVICAILALTIGPAVDKRRAARA